MQKFRIITIIICITFGMNGYSQQFFESGNIDNHSNNQNSGIVNQPFHNYDQGTENGPPGFEDDVVDNDQGAPIDQWLFMLFATGAFTGFYFLRQRRQELEVK